MANEFNKVLNEFTHLALNYCQNAKKFMPTSDHVKLLEIYETGLSAMLDGVWERFREAYASTSEGHQAEIDAYVKMTGMIPMLQAANRVIGPQSFNAEALYKGEGIFHKPKAMIQSIPGFIPIVGWAKGALDLIDDVITNIRDLIPADKTTTTGRPTTGVYDPNSSTTQIPSCTPFKFPIPGGPRDVQITYDKCSPSGSTRALSPDEMPDVEVEADGKKQPDLTGKNKSLDIKNCREIQLHVKGDPDQFNASFTFKYASKK
jgi:hypothetical protein